MCAGILVATERGIVYDTISSFVGRMIVEALVALAASWFTFGASLGAFVAAVDIDAAIQAETTALHVGKLMKAISKFAQKFAKMGSRAETLAKDLDRAAGKLRMKAGGNKGLKIISRNRYVHGSPNPVAKTLINASHRLEHSPLNNVHDVLDDWRVKAPVDVAKEANEVHRGRE